MTIIPNKAASAAVTLLTAVGILGFASLSAQAEMAPISVVSGKSAVVKTAAGKGKAQFDWLNQGTKAAVITVAEITPPPGKGSWICSPSGFGSKSQCYRR